MAAEDDVRARLRKPPRIGKLIVVGLADVFVAPVRQRYDDLRARIAQTLNVALNVRLVQIWNAVFEYRLVARILNRVR